MSPVAAAAAKIVAGFSCNNRCGFCMDRRHAGSVPDKDTAEVRREMTRARRRGARRLDLLGGELTLRPDLMDLIGFARKAGFTDILLTTNGRTLCYPRYAAQLAGSGLTELRLSLHGDRAALHDAQTAVPGSFRQLLAGARNLRAAGFTNLGTNTTVTRANYRRLPEIVRLAARLGARRANLIYVGARGDADLSAYSPRVRAAAPFIRRALAEDAGGITVRALNLPLPCYFQDVASQIDDHQVRERGYVRPAGPRAYREAEREKLIGRVKPRACAPCAVRGTCPGADAEYLRHFGDSEIRPVRP